MMFSNCQYDAAGSIICVYRGLPFNCSESETPEQWAQLQEKVASGEIEVAAYEPPAPPSEAEVRAAAEAAARVRRDQLLEGTDWLVMRHRDEIDTAIETTLSEQQFRSILMYRQALRGISDQASWPLSPDWPELPSV